MSDFLKLDVTAPQMNGESENNSTKFYIVFVLYLAYLSYRSSALPYMVPLALLERNPAAGPECSKGPLRMLPASKEGRGPGASHVSIPVVWTFKKGENTVRILLLPFQKTGL